MSNSTGVCFVSDSLFTKYSGSDESLLQTKALLWWNVIMLWDLWLCSHGRHLQLVNALNTRHSGLKLGCKKMISVPPLGFFHPGSRCLPINIFLKWKLPWEVGGWSGYQTKGLAVRGLDLSLCLRAQGNGNKYTSPKERCGPEPELSKKIKRTAFQRLLLNT